MPVLLQRVFTRRLFGRLALGLACLTVLAVAGLTIMALVVNARGNRNWRAYQQQAHARGVKLALREFRPAAIPETENFAAIPIFEQAFANARKGLKKVHAFDIVERDDWPDFGQVASRDLTNLSEFARFLRQAKRRAREHSSSGDSGREILDALSAYEPDLRQLREASLRPGACFPVDWDATFAADLPHYSVIQAATQLSRLRVLALLDQGTNDAALDELAAILRWGRHLEDEPGVIAGLTRMISVAAACNLVYEGLARHQWRDADLQRIEAALSTENLLASYSHALASDRALMNAFIDTLLDPPVGVPFSTGPRPISAKVNGGRVSSRLRDPRRRPGRWQLSLETRRPR
ncbi:MAG: hypothetical protein M3463_18710 [Verrucomicrobiota bacterium]|nr:hypothetical protein [Verrucomicrobiota bacterium]